MPFLWFVDNWIGSVFMEDGIDSDGCSKESLRKSLEESGVHKLEMELNVGVAYGCSERGESCRGTLF